MLYPWAIPLSWGKGGLLLLISVLPTLTSTLSFLFVPSLLLGTWQKDLTANWPFSGHELSSSMLMGPGHSSALTWSSSLSAPTWGLHTVPSRSAEGLWVSMAISSSVVFPSSMAKSRALAESAETWWTPGQVFGHETCSLPVRPKCSSSFPQEAPNQQVGLAEELTPWGPRDRPLLAKLCSAAGQTTHHRRTGSGNVTDWSFLAAKTSDGCHPGGQGGPWQKCVRNRTHYSCNTAKFWEVKRRRGWWEERKYSFFQSSQIPGWRQCL